MTRNVLSCERGQKFPSIGYILYKSSGTWKGMYGQEEPLEVPHFCLEKYSTVLPNFF